MPTTSNPPAVVAVLKAQSKFLDLKANSNGLPVALIVYVVGIGNGINYPRHILAA